MKNGNKLHDLSNMSNLKKLRLQKKCDNDGNKLTLKYMAAFIGCTPKTYANYERLPNDPNYQPPYIHYLIKLADFFNVSTDYILGRDNFRKPKNGYISRQTGLSDDAIDILNRFHCAVLRKKKTRNPETALNKNIYPSLTDQDGTVEYIKTENAYDSTLSIDILNTIISANSGWQFQNMLAAFRMYIHHNTKGTAFDDCNLPDFISDEIIEAAALKAIGDCLDNIAKSQNNE